MTVDDNQLTTAWTLGSCMAPFQGEKASRTTCSCRRVVGLHVET